MVVAALDSRFSAKLLEDQNIPSDTVAPGTRVTLRYPDTGEIETFRILGPWDCIEPDIINYKAPLAQALLGTKVGGQATATAADGERTVIVDSIEPIVGD